MTAEEIQRSFGAAGSGSDSASRSKRVTAPDRSNCSREIVYCNVRHRRGI